MEEESKPAPPPSIPASIPAASPRDYSQQALILLILLTLVGLITALGSLGNVFAIISGTAGISEDGPVFRFIMALFTLCAAVLGIVTGCGAFWTSRQAKNQGSASDTKAANDPAKLAALLCYFGWIIFICLTLNLAMSL